MIQLGFTVNSGSWFKVNGSWFMVNGERLMVMTQDQRWQIRYDEVMNFIETNHRNPSKHRIEEHLMLNFIKHNRKLMNKGEMKTERVRPFNELMSLMEKFKRVNQYD